MSVKKIFKWLLLLFGVLVVVVAVLMFNPGFLKGQIEKTLKAK
jgi:hypothetical protein